MRKRLLLYIDSFTVLQYTWLEATYTTTIELFPNLNQRHQKSEGFRNSESKILQVNIFSLSVGCLGYWCKFIRILLRRIRSFELRTTPTATRFQLLRLYTSLISCVMSGNVLSDTVSQRRRRFVLGKAHVSSSMTRKKGWVINDGVIKRTGKRLGF